MSEPERLKLPVDDAEQRIMVGGVTPPDTIPPTTAYSYNMATNSGIVLFGAAAIFFCLHDLMQAFLIAVLIVIALAVGNIVFLTIALRQRLSYAAALKALRAWEAAREAPDTRETPRRTSAY